jgi:hypothetical protein
MNREEARAIKRRPLVYVAGPLLSVGRATDNLRRAVAAGERLFKAGVHAHVPHLNFIWEAQYSHRSEEWLDLDFTTLVRCDYVLRLRGESPGADREEELAGKLNIPVFHSVNELLGAIKEKNEARKHPKKLRGQ